jgi:hypothetical protein
MASWLFTPSAFDLLLDKATSPLLPIGTHDLATNLDLADQIRAKQVQPRVAAQAIKRKLTDRNPNVQLLALRVSLVGMLPLRGSRRALRGALQGQDKGGLSRSRGKRLTSRSCSLAPTAPRRLHQKRRRPLPRRGRRPRAGRCARQPLPVDGQPRRPQARARPGPAVGFDVCRQG